MKNNQSNNDENGSNFGLDLANQVADRLETCPLMHRHKEFSGMGLAKNPDGTYVYGEVYDGEIKPEMEFKTKEEFISWLTIQSDQSLSMRADGALLSEDQAVRRERLLRYIKYSEKSTAGDF